MAEIKIQVVLDSTAFFRSVQTVQNKLDQLSGKPISFNADTSGLNSISKVANDTSTAVTKTGEAFSTSATKMVRWMSIGNGISSLKRAFKEALDTMKAVDSELVNIAKVTDLTSGQIEDLKNNAFELATAYGRTADEVLKSATEFARAGYGDQIEQMAELSLLTQNVGDMTATQANKFLLAADAAWQLDGNAQALTEILDGMNAVSNKNATDMAKLADGVSVAGSVFSTSGESVQMFTALLGAGTAATQRSGSEVARGLRTILMNIRQIKGETEDGELIDGESISKASTALKEYAGIQTIVDGELRKGSDVLRELAGKWDSLGSVAQSALAEALGGKNRANILVALMSDWGAVEKQMRDYASGAGSALAENEKYLDSWTAKSAKLSAAWTEFVSASLDSGTIKSILDGTTNIIDALGNLSTAALAALGYITAAKLPAMINGFTALRSELGSLIQGFKKGEGGTSAFGRAMQTTQGKISMAQAGIAALTTVVLVAVTAYNSWKSAQKEALRSATESAERTSESYKRLTDLINEYKDLASNCPLPGCVDRKEPQITE